MNLKDLFAFLNCDYDSETYESAHIKDVFFSYQQNLWIVNVTWSNVVLCKNIILDYFKLYKHEKLQIALEHHFAWPIVTDYKNTNQSIALFLGNFFKYYLNSIEVEFQSEQLQTWFNSHNLKIDVQDSLVTIQVTTKNDRKTLQQYLLLSEEHLARLGFEQYRFQININHDPNHATRSVLSNDLEAVIHNSQFDDSSSEHVNLKLEPTPIIQQKQSTPEKLIKSNNVLTWIKYERPTISTVDLMQQSCISLQKLKSSKQKQTIIGRVFKIVYKEQWQSLIIYIADESEAISLRINLNLKRALTIQKHDMVKVYGTAANYKNELRFYPEVILKIKTKSFPNLKNESPISRVELHCHTKMSVMDGVGSVTDYFNWANQMNMSALAFTDHNNVQAFPKIYTIAQQYPHIKPIYGIELNVYDDQVDFYIKKPQGFNLQKARYVFFDLETTGLNAKYDEIIEFGAVIFNGLYDHNPERITILIKSTNPISQHITDLTGITNQELNEKGEILQTVFPRILSLLNNSILIAHNAWFDYSFLKATCQQLNSTFPESVFIIDTLPLSRLLLPTLKSHRLNRVCKKLKIPIETSALHRGEYDAWILSQMYIKLLEIMETRYQVKTDHDLIKKIPIEGAIDRQHAYHVTILIKNQAGLRDLYEVVSLAHTKFYANNQVRFPKNLLDQYRKHWLIGSACADNELFDELIRSDDQSIETKMQFYDYIEIQPLTVYQNLINRNQFTPERIELIIKNLIKHGRVAKVPIVATSSAHYVPQHDKIIRDIYIATKGLKGKSHPLYNFNNPNAANPDQHIRSTSDMLQELAFLNDSELVYEIVITNSQLINQKIDTIDILKHGLFYPVITEAEAELEAFCYLQLQKRYGSHLHPIVKERVRMELDVIKKNNYSVIYWIAYKLVAYSLKNNFLVGSRGSVGSSFVAFLTNITEVNALQPHYLCSNPECLKNDFEVDNLTYKCGFDLPQRNCQDCGAPMIGDGHNIPFATFLGINNNKIPDIDLNFADNFQERAHNFIRQIFKGKGQVLRAGTISTVAERTAETFVKKYLGQYYPETNFSYSYIAYLADKCQGVKRTTGQHPGGIIIVPQPYEIIDFTPFNYPADTVSKNNWFTSHFDFHFLHDNLLKIDALGHMDPAALELLEKLTHIKPQSIPTNDKQVLSLFLNCSALKVDNEYVKFESLGIIGIPEFGTNFVRRMVGVVKPQTFADLVKISGLSHGTNVWSGNADLLIQNNIVDLSQVIGCRDDIMTVLHEQYHLELLPAFNIMERVRKGILLDETQIKLMQDHQVPNWYIDSCLKIKYLFPKAHATAYVLMAWRIAWFKVYYPIEYYAVYFSTRVDYFDLENALGTIQDIKKVRDDIQTRQKKYGGYTTSYNANLEQRPTNEELKLLDLYDILIEMKVRGLKIISLDVNRSHATHYLIITVNEERVILPPLSCVKYMGYETALSIVQARRNRFFSSVEDLQHRTKINQTNLKDLTELNTFTDSNGQEKIPYSDNMSFF